MGSRQLRALVALLTLSLGASLLTGCDRPSPTRETPAEGSAEPEPTTRPTGGGETTGLVGTDVVAETVEIPDEGPEDAPVILFTAGIKGYTEPCGCTLDLVLGGIDRVVGSARTMAESAPHALVLDGGNTLFEHPTIDPLRWEQEVRKTEVIVAALQRMGTVATVPGRTDLAAGVGFYVEALGATEIDVLAANLRIAHGDVPFGPASAVYPLGDTRIGVIGAVDAARFDDLAEVSTSPAAPAVQAAADTLATEGVDTVVLLFQGDLIAARTQLGEVSGVDFIIIGADPRETDEVESVGSAFTLEAFDQGRYVGRLKLHRPEGAEGPWQNARVGSDEEAARIERVIAGIEEQLAGMPDFAEGEAPPIVVRQQERLADLRAELEAIGEATATFPDGEPRFLFRPMPMEPGYPTDAPMTEEMRRYNQALREINLGAASPPEPAAPGMPHYVGDQVCATCHVEETRVWQNTAHAHAIQTLIDRDKQFDRSCIGCHVTGYEQPGGSTLGHTDGLVNVQCEQCHGPGSMHAADPSLMGGPQGVVLGDSPTTCTGCHNEEHSPRFDYPTYLPRILGPGHGQ